MYRTADGQEVFVIDGHTHLWDASPANQKNKYGRGWIDCFYAYHKNLSPAEYVWPLEKYEKYTPEDIVHDEFVKGYVDLAILQPTYLKDFYIKGVKLYTAEWRGDSKGYKLSDPEAYRYLEECVKLGITNIHVHKGPTIYPLNRDAFDVADVDDAASVFTDLNFIVEHAGLPRIEDFCWIATQESNVYAGLAVVLPFIQPRPRYFAELMANLLFWIGPDKILFGSDYALWEPKWLVEKFMAFQIPEDLQAEFGVKMTMEARRNILGLNAARLYGINPEEQLAKTKDDTFSHQAQQLHHKGGGIGVQYPASPL